MMIHVEGKQALAVFFDMDDTLYDQLSPFRLAVEAYYKESGKENPVLDFDDLFKRVRAHSDELWDDYLAGKMTIQEMRNARLSIAFAEIGITLNEVEAALIQQNYETEQGRIALPEGFSEYIHRLNEAGIVTGLITNGPVEHQTFKLRTLGIDKLFPLDRLFISDGVGFTKPDPRIFHYVNEQTNTLPANCYYVGDSWRNDVAGADAAGWNMIWLNRRQTDNDQQYTLFRIIKQLDELYDFVPEKK